MRNSAIAVAFFFALLCTFSVKGQTCYANISAAIETCLIGTGCDWADATLWSCNSIPNGGTFAAYLSGPGSYQLNINSATIASLQLMSLNVGSDDPKNNTYQVLTTSGTNFQLSDAARVYGRGIFDADFGAAAFTGQLLLLNGGQFNYRSGIFSGGTSQITVSAGAQFNITTAAAHSLGQPLQNSGTVRIRDGGAVMLTSAVQLNNDGLLEIGDGSTVGFTNLGSEKITSAGTIRFRSFSSSAISSIDALLESSGMLESAILGNGKITGENSVIDNVNIVSGSSLTFSAPNLSLKNLVSNGSLTWASGDISIKSAGSILNDISGLWTITAANRIVSGDNTAFIRNRGTVSITATGIVNFNAPVQLLGGNFNQNQPDTGSLSFTSLRVAGGRISGSGNIVASLFYWDSGDITGFKPIEITGAATISGAAKTLSGSRSLIFSGPSVSQISGSLSASSSGTSITITSTGTVNFGNAALTLTNPLVNNGKITGVLTTNGGFTNNGVMGAVGFSATSNAIKVQVNGLLTLSSSSVLNIDLFSDTDDYGYLRCNTVANLDGVLNIRARDGLYGASGSTLTLVSASTIIGNFSAINLDITQWSNPNKCTVKANFDQVTGVTLAFTGCSSSSPVPTPKPASTRLRTFIIVFVVIVVIIVAVGVIAKCQKKCRKRPWDRLRDDRY